MKKFKIVLVVGGILAVLATAARLLRHANFEVLNAKGTIAAQQRDLILFAATLSLLVVVPVFILIFSIAWRYREGNKAADYRPDWDHSRILETVWWLIPITLITVLSVVTWQTSHSLDPYRPIVSSKAPLHVQVVALEWKWLFIYPDQHIASVNLLEMPVNRPVSFQISADAPMNSFWIPQLGGQIYAMNGMSTQLHLMATQPGDYNGYSANISGAGFADMRFTARAVSQADFDAWASASQNAQSLDMNTYNQLAKPSVMTKPMFYALGQQDLYDTIVLKFMNPVSDNMQTYTEGH